MVAVVVCTSTDKTYPVERLVLDNRTAAKRWVSITELFIRGIRVKLLRTIECVDMIGWAHLVDNRITPSVARRRIIKETELNHVVFSLCRSSLLVRNGNSSEGGHERECIACKLHDESDFSFC